MDILVGCTGFVGRNLAQQHAFDRCLHSVDVETAYGSHPDLLVYAGVRSEMFLANRDPQADLAHIQEAIHNIQEIGPKECILISTVAVYPDTVGADERTELSPKDLTAYGANRLVLEKWVEENIPNSMIVHLPAIYGDYLKKNFLYDYIHVIPGLLTESKLQELSPKAPELRDFYLPRGDGFYKCRELTEEERGHLKTVFRALGFSALNFTDSRSVYQFYWLKHLWEHLEIARSNHLRRINLVTPPLSVRQVFKALSGRDFENQLQKAPYYYDLHTRYSSLFGGPDGYLMTETQCLEDIRQFVIQEGGDCL